jgi:hypothetical protein
MRYQKFIIRNYRAITGPLEVDVERHGLMPIIGVNESGKTTILNALFAFDHTSDALNDGRHLRDTSNIFRTDPPNPTVTAELRCGREELIEALDELESVAEDAADEEDILERKRVARFYKKRLRTLPETIAITRDLATDTYSIQTPPFGQHRSDDLVAREIIRHTPYILYFDDFRDSVEEMIEIVQTQRDSPEGWLAIFEQLFNQTDKSFSVFNLRQMEARRRKGLLARVKGRLNRTLTQEWQNFRLDDANALEISLEYDPGVSSAAKEYLKLEIVEKDLQGNQHYFYLRDRSKGFFWFFNFVMKLEFNPKVLRDDDEGTIYLLDEPGSYLHASAQSKLCKKLRQLSQKNRVVYCTHSHYLLDPAVIPLSKIRVADREPNGNIKLVPIHEHEGNILERRSAFQPVIDALEIKPFLLDLTNELIIIVEGIYDYYCLEMFKLGRNVGVLPSVGANSIPHYVSLMIAWRVAFKALWDNDEEGRAEKTAAEEIFGVEIAQDRFFLLPPGKGKKRIMQDLLAGEDLRMIRMRLGIPSNSSFQKTITSLYYDSTRTEILNDVSQKTKENFEELYQSLQIA